MKLLFSSFSYKMVPLFLKDSDFSQICETNLRKVLENNEIKNLLYLRMNNPKLFKMLKWSPTWSFPSALIIIFSLKLHHLFALRNIISFLLTAFWNVQNTYQNYQYFYYSSENISQSYTMPNISQFL